MESPAAEPFHPPLETTGAWLRRLGPIFLMWFFVFLLVPAGGYTLTRLRGQGLDLVAVVERLVLPVGTAAALAVVITALMPTVAAWIHERGVAKVRRIAPTFLEPGEELQAFCSGMFLGPRGYAGSGYLVLTDRRLLRVQDTFSGYRWGLIGPRDEVELLEAQRRSARGLVRGTILRGLGTARALVLQPRGGSREHALVVAKPLLDAFCVWLRAQGVAVGFRNDEDLPEAPRLEPLELTARAVPGERRHSAVLFLWTLLVLGAVSGVGVYLVSPRDPAPPKPAVTLPPFVTSRPGIPKRQVQFALATKLPKLAQRGGSPPQGMELLLAEIRVATASVTAPSGTTTRGLCVYQVVRIGGGQAVLRVRPRQRAGKGGGSSKARSLPWELLGKPGDSDGALVDAAERRLSLPETRWKPGG